ncbi:interferon-induced protein with tetratricopeptide repeats 1-like [Prinia subflava]|uniref:interferon-induced protein with tetratricopeptide repeats 1-like n=1 Tax=Prinia subflava TaxID=208062 RepID=UPI002FDF1D60
MAAANLSFIFHLPSSFPRLCGHPRVAPFPYSLFPLCSREELKEQLDALQCHFTWKMGIQVYNPQHLLQKLEIEINHTAHQNQVALLGLQAHLYQLNNQSAEALRSLRAAEEHNEQQEEAAATAGSVIIYGNYAWVHYLQGSYQEARSYLQRAQQLCPHPWDMRLIPHIQAQKGWSLLVIRAQNGDRARECFDLALMLEPDNRSFHTGLAMALYSSWKFSWQPDAASEATIHLERVVREQPNNYRAKIYLAQLLEHVAKERSIGLVEECAEESSDPEVLKLSIMFWIPRSTDRAVEIARRALEDDPGYHLLYQALAKSYKQQWLQANEEDKDEILDVAINHLQQIVQGHPDLDITIVKLQLAELIGERDPAREEEIYMELQEQSDTLSLRCRQGLLINWGKFLLYRRGSQDRAKAKFMEAYSIPMQTFQRRDCGRRLRRMAETYRRNGDAETADGIYRFLQEADRHLPGQNVPLGLEDGDQPPPAE